MVLNCDIHIHSCVSPCGDLSMAPSYIAQILHEKNIQLAALTDHNTSLNCPAFQTACKKYKIIPLFGMEAQSSEEVHILCLFSELQTALAFSNKIYDTLPPIMNNPEKMGDQVYVDENDDIIGEVEKYLVTSIPMSIDEIAKQVHELKGLVIPAHVDRPAFSLSSQFGFIPEGDWDALEVVRLPSSYHDQSAPPKEEFNTLGYPLTTSSDAHYPEHIARRPFTLDIDDLSLYNDDGSVNIETIRSALQKRPR